MTQRTEQMDLEQFIGGIETIPPTTRVLSKLSTLIADPDSTIADVVSMIRYDASLTAVLLRVSNSAYYGVSAGITNLEDAINRLGFREVYKITAAVSARQVFKGPLSVYHMEAEEVWLLSLATAILTEQIAELCYGEPAPAYTNGLLYLVGKWVIQKRVVDFEEDITYPLNRTSATVEEWERKTFGFDHGRVGGALLKKWGFPVSIYQPIIYYLCPDFTPFDAQIAYRLGIAARLAPYLIETKDWPDPELDGVEEIEDNADDPDAARFVVDGEAAKEAGLEVGLLKKVFPSLRRRLREIVEVLGN